MKGIQLDVFNDLPLEDEPGMPPAGPLAPLLDELKVWCETGWIRHLDAAFPRFLRELEPDTPDAVLLAAAMLVHLEGRGHTCLVLAELIRHPDRLLGWAPPAMAAWHARLAALPTDPAEWTTLLQHSRLIGVPGAADLHNEPMVFDGERLYLRRYWGYERHVAVQLRLRTAVADVVDAQALQQVLSPLFGSATPQASFDWQQAACAVALRGRLSIITGGPGTGKTYTAARLLAALYAMDPDPARLRVALAAPTGKAAARLKQSIDQALQALAPPSGEASPLMAWASHLGAARTLHSLLGARPGTRRFARDSLHPLEVDVLIVDEASMVHLEMMSALLDALPPTARLVLLGDKDQLSSVEAGAVLGDLCRDAEHGRYAPATRDFIEAATGQRLPDVFVSNGSPLAQQTVMLRESRRFGGPIGQLALAINRGDAEAAGALLASTETSPVVMAMNKPSPAALVRLAIEGRPGAEGGYRSALHLLREGPADDEHEAWVRRVLTAFERFRLLCAVREGEWGVAGLNAAVERGLIDAGLLVKRGDWYEGRPVMVTRNDAALGVFNGDIGMTFRSPTGGPLRAYFLEGPELKSVAASRLPDVETAWAMTVHKSQGSEFEHTVLVLPEDPSRVLTRELVYTGVTRARQAFTLVSGRERAFAEALAEQTHRASGLLQALQREDDTPRE
ncbi:MAG: hypothetical protein RLZZ618_1158 [Pseudomonadota bacterium]